ncbi:CvpA family protein [Natroniella sp. ANB-PHB2]|uniref:CvpA family protein n=1 Tax=Natroniella sp. ANB-PHB2 TaxID=3384444 RepID=UPI0038D45EEF
MDFNLIDVIIFSLFLIFMIKGYYLGLIKQITSFLGVILGAYIALEQYSIVADLVTQQFNLELRLAEVISFLVIIVVVSFIINYIGSLLNKFLDIILLSFVDNLAGVVVGFFKAFAISYILVLILEMIPLEMIEQQLELSYLTPKLLQISPVIEEKIIEFSQY